MNIPIPENEGTRLSIVKQYDAFTSTIESDLHDLTQLAADICNASGAYISLVSQETVSYYATIGLGQIEPRSRQDTLDAYVLQGAKPLIITNTSDDERSSLAIDGQDFFVGIPLLINDEYVIGSLSVVAETSKAVSETEIKSLQTIANQIVKNLNYQQQSAVAQTLLEQSQQNEQTYQQILDAITDMVLVKKEKSAIFWANKAFRDYYDMTNDQLQDMIDAPFNEPDYTLQYVQDDEYVFSTGKVLDIPEEPVTRHDGVVEPFHTIKSPIFDQNGNVILTVGVSRCISAEKTQQELVERKTAELEQSRNLLTLIINTIPDAIFWKDTASRYLGANKQFAQDGGMNVAELIGKTDYDMPWKKEESDFFIATDQRIMAANQAEIGIIEPQLQADGKQAWLETNKIPLQDKDGQVIGILGTYRDITARIDAQHLLQAQAEQLKNTQQFQELLLNQLPLAVFWKDRQGRFLGLNKYYADLAGLPVDEILGKTNQELLWGQAETDEIMESDQRVMRNNQAELNLVHTMNHANGSQIKIETNKIPIHDTDGEVIGVLGTFQDITDRQKANEIFEKRAAELDILIRLSRAVSSTAELHAFLPEAVNLITSSFNLYHANLYLMNETGNLLILDTGAGEVGRELVSQGYQIPIDDELSLVARVARTKKAIILDDLQATPNYLPNPLLPDSRASMAIPLITGEHLLGVLNIQANQANYFSEEDIRIQTTLAEQIALAIQNERNEQQTAEALDELQNITRRLTAEGWDDYLRDQNGTGEISYVFDSESLDALNHSSHEKDSHPLNKHIEIYGETIGQLELGIEENTDEDTVAFIEIVAERLGQHLDNLRLAEQAQLRAQELQAINNLTQSVSGQLNKEELLHQILNELQKIYDFDVLTFDNIVGDYVYPLLAYESGDYFTLPHIELSKTTYLSQVVETGQPLLMQNPQTDNTYGRSGLDQTHSMIFLPIYIGETLAMVMSLQSYEAGRHTADDLPLLTGITNYIGIGMQNAILFEEANRQAERERLVNEITRKIQSAVTIETALRITVQELSQLFHADYTEIEISPR